MGTRAGGRRTGPKCIAIVGPFASGKTTLLEAILARTGAIPRQSPVSSGNTVSDHSPEARAHAMSVEATFATTDFMGEQITFVDCPGSVEFAFDRVPLLDGTYLLTLAIQTTDEGTVYDWREQQYRFEVMNPRRTAGRVAFPMHISFGGQ